MTNETTLVTRESLADLLQRKPVETVGRGFGGLPGHFYSLRVFAEARYMAAEDGSGVRSGPYGCDYWGYLDVWMSRTGL